jgi:ligand-binding sensor domain-containing protein
MRYTLLAWVVLFISHTSLGQAFSYQQINQETGLPQDFIYGTIQDQNGFLWISTGRGLTRYDGRTIQNYHTSDGLADEFVTSSLVTQSGHFLIGHYLGNITRFDGVNFQPLLTDTLQSEIVSMMEEKGAIWVVSKSGRIIHYSSDFYSYEIIAPGELQGKIVYEAAFVNDLLLAATSEGLYAFQWKNNKLIWVESQTDLQYKVILSIHHPPNTAHCWVGTDDGYIYQVTIGTTLKVTRQFLLPLSDTDGISALLWKGNRLWIGTLQHGLFSVDDGGKSWRSFTIENGYPLKNVNTIYADQQDNLWLGTLGNGVIRLYPSSVVYYDASHLKVDEITGAAPWGDCHYVTTNQGLFTLAIDSTGQGVFSPITSIPRQRLLSILAYDANRLLIGTEENGIYWFTPNEKAYQKLTLAGLDAGSSIKARQFCLDTQGNIWIATIGDGVYEVDKTGKIIAHYSTSNGFIHNDIFAIHADRQGRVWFGSQGAGLAMLTPDRKLKRFSQEGVFPSKDVNAITEDEKGRVWIATDGQGYFRYEYDSFIPTGTNHTARSNYLKGIVTSPGLVWYSYRKGISFYEEATEKTHDLTREEGIQDLETYASSLITNSAGDIVALNEKGVSLVFAQTFRTTTLPAPVITSIHYQFKNRVRLQSTPDETQAGKFPSARLTYDINHLTFTVNVPAINRTEPVYFRYAIRELEPDWAPATIENRFTYSGLSPGSYTLRVQASTDPGAWVDPVLEYRFIIQSPYWEKWWFYLLQASGICLLFGLTYYLTKNSQSKSTVARVMMFTSIFILFDYVQNLADPVTSGVVDGAPIYKTLINLGLALLLLPLEQSIKGFFKEKDF